MQWHVHIEQHIVVSWCSCEVVSCMQFYELRNSMCMLRNSMCMLSNSMCMLHNSMCMLSNSMCMLSNTYRRNGKLCCSFRYYTIIIIIMLYKLYFKENLMKIIAVCFMPDTTQS